MVRTLQEGSLMVQVIKRYEQVLIVDAQYEKVVRSILQQKGDAIVNNGLILIDIGERPDLINEVERNLSGIGIKKYLDRFYLAIPRDDVDARQAILDRFFSLIADEYETIIEIDRNLENISNLLDELGSIIGPLSGCRILDYGCGTGLSVHAISTKGLYVDLVGFDSCPNMRRNSAKKGMTVYGPGGLARQQNQIYDGIFASYLFHLKPDNGGIRLLWSRLRTGGAMVANFHKNEGIDYINECISKLGGAVSTCKRGKYSERHGAYIAYVKE